MTFKPLTKNQIPDTSILDRFEKQTYLGNAYWVTSAPISISDTTEVALLYLANSAAAPAVGAGISIFQNLRQFFCDDVTVATGIIYKIYANVSSVTSGSALTPVNKRLLSANTSIANVLLFPTWTVTGTPIAEFAVNFNAPHQDNELLILDPTQNIMITGKATASTTALINLGWFEL